MSHSTVKSLRSTDTGDIETVSLLHQKNLASQSLQKMSKLSEKQSLTHIFMDFKEKGAVLKIRPYIESYEELNPG